MIIAPAPPRTRARGHLLARLARPWLGVSRSVGAGLGIFGLALTIRVTYNLTVARAYVPAHDAVAYVSLAQHLLTWHCYCLSAPAHPTTIRPPLFPIVLAAVSAVTGPSALNARLALSVVGALTCVLAAGIARDLFGGRAGLLAGLIAATYPQLFIYDAWLYSESLAIFLFAASCLAVMRVVRHPPGWRWVLAGALLGLTALARPNGLYALVAVGIWAVAAVWTRLTTARRAALSVALLLAGCALVMAPWVARNYVVTDGAFVPATTISGIVIAGSYNDEAYSLPGYQGNWVNPFTLKIWNAYKAQLPRTYTENCWGPCEVALDRAMTRMGEDWALSHLRLLPQLLVMRTWMFWTPASPPIEAGMPIWRPFAVGYPALVILLALVGMVAVRRRWRDALIPVLFAATVVVGGLVFYGSPRMRAPMEPMLVVLAAGGLMWLVARGRVWSATAHRRWLSISRWRA
jgi:4-amino-4-deoxy-L-arabinose transferase-like glycosyltransferase